MDRYWGAAIGLLEGIQQGCGVARFPFVVHGIAFADKANVIFPLAIFGSDSTAIREVRAVRFG